MERTLETAEGKRRAVAVFWSIPHARRAMYAAGFYPENGWDAIERDDEELETLFKLLEEVGISALAYVEPAPGASELSALLRPEELLEMLRMCGRE